MCVCVQLKLRFGSIHAQMDGTGLGFSWLFVILKSKSWILGVAWAIPAV